MEEILKHAKEIVTEVSNVTAGAPNEAVLRHEIENLLERHCHALDIPWIPFQLERKLSTANGSSVRFADVVHGAVIIEYEPPKSFSGCEGAKLREARNQAEDYARLLSQDEGRVLSGYVLVVWDGSHISFGRFEDEGARWERLTPFDLQAALRLLTYLKQNGVPLVHPQLLLQLVGPESIIGAGLIPQFFQAIRQASSAQGQTNKTKLLFTEWKRLFGQVVGVQSDRLKELLKQQGQAHQQSYSDDSSAYLFALNTYIALVAKLVAALSLPNASQNLMDPGVPVRQKIQSLESGQLFRNAGVSNMLIGDFFSWYSDSDDPNWSNFESGIEALIATLSSISFDVTQKDPNTTRDLFKGLYQTFVPSALRHALGEYYTPDWLAAHALDLIGWSPGENLLDPTCGTGTFILEALRRRLTANDNRFRTPHDLLSGLYGIDLNPLAVLAARASLVVFLSRYLDPLKPVRLPIFLADAINTASVDGPICQHTILTEKGAVSFGIPKSLVVNEQFYDVMMRIRELIEASFEPDAITSTVCDEFRLSYLSEYERSILLDTITTLANLHRMGWDSIWTAILADRFAAAVIPRVRYIAGNPPWVKWSHLPTEYAAFIKDRCLQLGVFSQDRWVGGIESDISTVVTYEVIDKWLAPQGKMAFFITGTVFVNESSQGFRRFHLQHRSLKVKVLAVEDFDAIAPFEGVSNFPTLLVLERDGITEYPVLYRIWKPPINKGTVMRTFSNANQFRESANCEELFAAPVPGTDGGPWLKGTTEEHELWRKIFGPEKPHYIARKGVTTDSNGIFFIKVLSVSDDGETCQIQNDPTLGRRAGIPKITATVEAVHVFPLLRGRNVGPFSAIPDPDYRILLPQREMHGDPELPKSARHTHQFLSRFKEILEQRSSYRRYQKGKPYWSVWSTGPYTFSKYKVLWKEMSGGKFVAAYIGEHLDPLLGQKVVIPDHKLYFVPVAGEDEAAYLTAFLNAPTISRAVSAYAAQLSLGVSVVEYLKIPAWDSSNCDHEQLAQLAKNITRRGQAPTDEENHEIDRLVRRLLDMTD